MQSLRFKILAVASTLVLLSQAGTVFTVLFTANRDVAERARASLETGARIFEQTTRARAEQLGATVKVLAADFAFKQAVASQDLATIDSALANHARRAGADLALLLDETGGVLASTGAMESAHPGLAEWTGIGGPARSTLVHGGVAYEVLTVPVLAPLPVAWVSMGFRVSDEYLRRIEELTGLHATVLARRGDSYQLVASRLEEPLRQPLLSAIDGRPPSSARTLDIAGYDFLVIARPFIPEAADIEVLLTVSLDEAMAPYRLLQSAAIVLGALPLLLALAGAFLLSRAVTRPVQTLADAARRVKAGDYSRPVTVRSGDELAELASAFNAMQTDISRREARIVQQARHDTLTGLPNRDFALEQLDTALDNASRDGGSVALMVIDLNATGEIAASLGHDIADDYVRHAAEQLRLHLDSRFLLARIESDRFMTIMPGLDADSAASVGERLLQRLEPGIGLPDLTVTVRPGIGISAFPEHGATHDQLLLRATVAQTDNRHAPSTVGVYHSGDEQRRIRRLTILGDLRRAARHEELKLYYQPKISLADGRLCGAEALVRWDHPLLGRLSPAEFIPIAEQSGNVSALTRWAVTAAARECRLWLEEGLDIAVSVNLSAHDLLDKDLPWFVLDVLRNHDLAPRYLIAEITEEGLVRDFANATLVLQRLRELGLRVSVDDFGTGYSSLAQIRNLPIDELKIDRTFVTQLPDNAADAAIVAAAIDLSHNLGLEFVAEGVETRPALRWLRERGCERAQGYLISPPLPADEFVEWVRGYAAGATTRTSALLAG